MNNNDVSLSRRRLIKGFSLLPAVAAGAIPASTTQTVPAYVPAFFNAAEWTFIHAACERLIPDDEHGPGAVALGVPEFLDRHMQTPYASGDIWYMQGPFIAAPKQFGYQGRLALREILRHGIGGVDAHCRGLHKQCFAELNGAQQDACLHALEKDQLELGSVPSKTFFDILLAEVRNGYFADPRYGGNKNMGSWKMIGYPGARADFADWVGVRDRPYPLPPVDLAGRRS